MRKLLMLHLQFKAKKMPHKVDDLDTLVCWSGGRLGYMGKCL